jgi:L-fucose isomerase-like protein
VPMEAVREAIRDADPEEAQALLHDFRDGAAGVLEPTSRDLEMAARVGAGLRSVVRAYDLDACSVRCFDLVTGLGTTGCLALSALLDQGIVAGCEGDVPAALTMLWMQAVSGGPSFMANPQDLDPAASTLWLAHCTAARGMGEGYTLRSHFESGLGVGIQGKLPGGPVTLARIGGPGLEGLFVSDGELLANGDDPQRCRTQAQVRLRGSVAPLLENPMGNHHVLVPGHWEARLREYHGLCVQA